MYNTKYYVAKLNKIQENLDKRATENYVYIKKYINMIEQEEITDHDKLYRLYGYIQSSIENIENYREEQYKNLDFKILEKN